MFDGVYQGQIVVGIFAALIDEVRQLWSFDSQCLDLLPELLNQRQLRVLIWLGEHDVKTDHPGAVSRQDIHQGRELRPGPGPASFRIEAFLIDRSDHHRRGGWHMPTRDETEVVGFQFDQVEERNAVYEEPDNDADSAECQGRRTNRAQGFKPSHWAPWEQASARNSQALSYATSLSPIQFREQHLIGRVAALDILIDFARVVPICECCCRWAVVMLGSFLSVFRTLGHVYRSPIGESTHYSIGTLPPKANLVHPSLG